GRAGQLRARPARRGALRDPRRWRRPRRPGGCVLPGGGRLMVSKRILVNLVVFFAASVLLVGYGAVTLFGNPFVDRRTVVTELPDAGGLRTGFSASHDGVVIGTVSDLQLRGD